MYATVHPHWQPARAHHSPPSLRDNSKKHQARRGAHNHAERPGFRLPPVRLDEPDAGLRLCVIAIMPDLELASVNDEMPGAADGPRAVPLTAKTDYRE